MPNYDINYDDRRFTEVERDEKEALSNVEKTYSGIINESDEYYQKQINAAESWEKKQTQLQQERTDFAIEQVEQQKDQAKKDYIKEQSGAYVDWQKQSGQYGAKAEQAADNGLLNSGYSESSQVAIYNQYQNRVAIAREAFSRANLEYDNDMKEARLQNSAALAQIAVESLQKKLELSLQGFQYKNSLVLEQANKKLEVNNMYYQRYQDVLKQINTENALAEEVRQYNEKMAEEKRQYDATLAEQQRQHNASIALEREKFDWQKSQAAKSSSSGGSSGGSSSIKKSSSSKSSSKSSGSSKINAMNTISSGGKSSSKGLEVDMDSVLSLGYGHISESTLNDLVARGKVIEYESGGKLKYKANLDPMSAISSGLFR